MKKINFFIVVVIVIVFSGCRSPKPVIGFKTIHDTITCEKLITYRDTIFVTEKAKVTLVTDCNNLSENPKFKQNKNAKLSLSKSPEGKLTVKCECDTLTIKAKLKDELQKEIQTKVRFETYIQKEKYVPENIKLLASIGEILIILVLGSVIIIIYKKIKHK